MPVIRRAVLTGRLDRHHRHAQLDASASKSAGLIRAVVFVLTPLWLRHMVRHPHHDGGLDGGRRRTATAHGTKRQNPSEVPYGPHG
jgi:hypothetical protein